MVEKVFTVSEFNKMVKNVIEDTEEFREFFLEGELSGITYYKSGHLYFSLKDSKSQIKCVAFNYHLKKIPKDLENGESVKIFGDIGFYEIRGDFQILVRHVERQNRLGEMFTKLEKLKLKLEREGLFSVYHKKSLPKCPQKIGVVTALNGAAFQDIINTTKKRYENIDIYIYPAKVQGTGAKEEIVRGIKELNKIKELDFIIVGRGGGSVEDLWSFNEESVARAIFKSEIPIISAVGHEIDYLLTDLVADIRASTPTQAIEIGVPIKDELKEKLLERNLKLNTTMNWILESKENKLTILKKNHKIKYFLDIFNEKSNLLIEKENDLTYGLKNILERKTLKLESKIDKVLSLNPLSILKRGYTITKIDGKMLKTVEKLKKNDIIETVFSDGKIISKVKEIEN